MAAQNNTASRKVAALQRRQLCVELRRSGKSYDEIAHQVGISKSQAHRHVESALAEAREAIDADAVELKAQELDRLNAMLSGLWTEARRGNHGAVDRVLKIMERRAKLLGLDAPLKVAKTNGAGDDAPDPTTYIVPVPPTMSMEEWLQQFNPIASPPSDS